jgi:hypothetical protein
MTTSIEERDRAAQKAAMLDCLRSVRDRLEGLDEKLAEAEKKGYEAELVFLVLRDIRTDLEQLEDTVPAISREA